MFWGFFVPVREEPQPERGGLSDLGLRYKRGGGILCIWDEWAVFIEESAQNNEERMVFWIRCKEMCKLV